MHPEHAAADQLQPRERGRACNRSLQTTLDAETGDTRQSPKRTTQPDRHYADRHSHTSSLAHEMYDVAQEKKHVGTVPYATT